ncbi:hypothetical protein ASPWEDRAFT_513580 [Aspergillus wentii DTO 134E9]|uniref:Uncharacterized protein n=1 Tax=Aspergillus wentii DTO 134E9 TaxID=1073089 RepID=A0A1L9RKS5_ASPWE|nr:uncharacterized protein ASPWEDRAFT_513580 [Aspergillus wentii DTO 134E9]OJJ35522.1 hypothetical protein ASPWEDRAFT_513580 [Aspergillus wentii DTO 134E9]
MTSQGFICRFNILLLPPPEHASQPSLPVCLLAGCSLSTRLLESRKGDGYIGYQNTVLYVPYIVFVAVRMDREERNDQTQQKERKHMATKKKGPKWRSEKGIREKTKQTGNWTPPKINGEGGVHSAPLESLALPLCNGVYLVCVHHVGGFAVKFAIEA